MSTTNAGFLRKAHRLLTAVVAVGVIALMTNAALESVGASKAHGAQQILGIQLTGNRIPETSSSEAVFYISGNVTGLYPGASTELPLTVTNPNTIRIKVTSLSVSVVASSKAGCSATGSNLAVGKYLGPSFILGSNRSKIVPVLITAPASLQDPCQGAKFKLSLSGRATSA